MSKNQPATAPLAPAAARDHCRIIGLFAVQLSPPRQRGVEFLVAIALDGNSPMSINTGNGPIRFGDPAGRKSAHDCAMHKTSLIELCFNYILILCAAHSRRLRSARTAMTDAKPRRPGREPGREVGRESGRNGLAASPGASPAAPAEPTPIIAPEPAPTILAAPVAAPPPTIIAPEPVMQEVVASAAPVVDAADDAWAAVGEMQAALARGFAEFVDQMTGIARSNLTAAADAATAMIGAHTFAEAVEISAGLARRGADAMIEGSARLSEIGAKAMTEASRPLLSRLNASWSAAGLG
jgi:hypothetical protein